MSLYGWLYAVNLCRIDPGHNIILGTYSELVQAKVEITEQRFHGFEETRLLTTPLRPPFPFAAVSLLQMPLPKVKEAAGMTEAPRRGIC